MLEADLAFFARLAKAASLTKAATELDVSIAAISKRLTALEQSLGVKLVQRTARAFNLTDEGEKLLNGSHEILQLVEQLRIEVSSPRQAPKGRLRINGTYGFGRRFLAPIIEQFARRYPEVQVQLILTDMPLDFATHAIDLCIWLDPLPEDNLIARRISPCRRILCASPQYLKQFGTPISPNELRNHRCIILRQTDMNFANWTFIKGRQQETIRVNGHLASNDGEVVKQWVLAGHGLMIRSEWDVSAEIQQRRLVALLTDYSSAPSDIIAWYPPGLQRTARLMRFLELLTESFRGPQSWRLQ
jgi:LysR family transcriptional regulator, transcriptional activator for dmlA